MTAVAPLTACRLLNRHLLVYNCASNYTSRRRSIIASAITSRKRSHVRRGEARRLIASAITQMKYKILVVEDDKDLQEYLRDFFLENDYLVDGAYEGSKALRKVEDSLPDIVVLDLGLPDISGETVCRELKKHYPGLPVIILTARDTTEDIVRGLSLGADDYIPKPFKGEELLARIRARLRQGKDSSSILKIGNLKLDNQKIEVKRGGKPIRLTQKEFTLLEYLMRNNGRVLSREMILNRVWSYSPDVESRVVDVYIGYLRKKVDSLFEKKLIHCIKGFGYMVKE